jgi:hypothetical protein
LRKARKQENFQMNLHHLYGKKKHLQRKKEDFSSPKLEFGILKDWDFNFNESNYQGVRKINIFICLKNVKKLVKSELLS